MLPISGAHKVHVEHLAQLIFLIAALNFKAYLAPLPGVFFDSTKSAIASMAFEALVLIVSFKLFLI